MVILSTPDKNKITNAKRVTVQPVFNVVPLVEVASATLAAAPTIPMIEISVTSTVGWGNFTVGQAFTIKNSAGKIKTWGVVRKQPTPTTFYTDAKSEGDFGYARDVMQTVIAGDTLHIYQHRPMWGLLSRATGEAAYKAWDLPYDGSGSRPVPVVNMGTHQQQWVNTSGRAVFTLNAGGSFDWLYGSPGIIAYAWGLPAGAVILSGSSTSSVVVVDLPAGFYEVNCTVTSINGRQASGWRWLFANSDNPASPYAPFNYKYGLDAIGGDASVNVGRELSVTVKGEAKAALYPGMMGVLTNRILFDGQELAEGVITKSFVGYMDDMTTEGQRGRKSVTLKFYGPLKLARSIPTATQLMEENTTPTEWTQVAPAYTHPGFAAYYILRNHATFLYNHDFYFSANLLGLRRRTYGFRAENIASQLQFLNEISTGEVNCRSDGTIYFVREPNHLPGVPRNALDTKYTWTENSVRVPLALEPKLRPDVAHVILDGISHDGSEIPSTYRALAPGSAQGQGLSKSDLPDVSVTAAGGQTELEFLVGDAFAYVNNPLASLPLTLLMPLDIFDPADDDWHKLNVPEDYLAFEPDRFGVRWGGSDGTGIRVRPVQVTRTWRKLGNVWLMDIAVNVRTESDGTRGIYLPIERGGAGGYVDPDGWIDTVEQVFPPDPPEINLGADFALAMPWNSFGEPGLSENFLEEVVNYARVRDSGSQALVGQVLDACWDKDAFYPSVLVVVWDGGITLTVSSCPNLLSPAPIWDTTTTIITEGLFYGRARIVQSTTAPYFLAVAYLSSFGVKIKRRSSGGSWGAVVNVGSGSFIDEANANMPLGMEISGSDIYLPGTLATGRWKLMKATGSAGAFSEIANHPGDDQASSEPMSTIKKDGSGNIFTTYNIYDDTPISTTISTFPTGNRIDLLPNTELALSSDEADADQQSIRYGVDYLAQSDEQKSGTVYTVSQLIGSFTTKLLYPSVIADPPGVSGTPIYWPPGNTIDGAYRVNVTAELTMLNSRREVLYSKRVQFHTLDKSQSWSVSYIGAAAIFGFPYFVQFNVTAAINVTFITPIENVRFVEVRFLSDSTELYGKWINNSVTRPELQLEAVFGSLIITNKRQAGRRMYRVSGSSIWTDVTPTEERVPRHPFALTAAGSELRMIATALDGSRAFWRSGDGGTLWAQGRSTNYNWLKRLQAGVFVAGGDNKLDISIDDLSTFEPRIGTWLQNVGQVGRIENALILIEKTP